jgi:hypothetical protein
MQVHQHNRGVWYLETKRRRMEGCRYWIEVDEFGRFDVYRTDDGLMSNADKLEAFSTFVDAVQFVRGVETRSIESER